MRRTALLTLLLSLVTLLPTMAAAQVYHPGQTVPTSVVKNRGVAAFFQNVAIPDTIFHYMQGRTMKADCTTRREDLRYLLCLHCDAEGVTHVGELVVSRRIADRVLDILRQLYDARYPIERMRLIDYWEADDEQSMRANNSSAFNYRTVSHTTTVSRHGLGLAVDINPLYNPYHKHLRDGREVVEPATGRKWLDRSQKSPYMIHRGDLCYRLFRKAGFVWGGDWKSVKDYQHFELKE